VNASYFRRRRLAWLLFRRRRPTVWTKTARGALYCLRRLSAALAAGHERHNGGVRAAESGSNNDNVYCILACISLLHYVAYSSTAQRYGLRGWRGRKATAWRHGLLSISVYSVCHYLFGEEGVRYAIAGSLCGGRNMAEDTATYYMYPGYSWRVYVVVERRSCAACPAWKIPVCMLANKLCYTTAERPCSAACDPGENQGKFVLGVCYW